MKFWRAANSTLGVCFYLRIFQTFYYFPGNTIWNRTKFVLSFLKSSLIILPFIEVNDWVTKIRFFHMYLIYWMNNHKFCWVWISEKKCGNIKQLLTFTINGRNELCAYPIEQLRHKYEGFDIHLVIEKRHRNNDLVYGLKNCCPRKRGTERIIFM